jgi:hypothetical protein
MKLIKDVQHRLLSFWRGGREVRPNKKQEDE